MPTATNAAASRYGESWNIAPAQADARAPRLGDPLACRELTISIADRPARAVVHALAQVLAGLEVRHVLSGERHGLARLRVPPLAGRPEVQREAAESADLDALPLRERIAHDLEDLLERELHILRGQMLLLRRDDLDELGFRPVARASGCPAPRRLRAAAVSGAVEAAAEPGSRTRERHDEIRAHRDHRGEAEASAREGCGARAQANPRDHERCALAGGAHRDPRIRQLLAALPAAPPGAEPEDGRGRGALRKVRAALQARQGPARARERRREPADPRLRS